MIIIFDRAVLLFPLDFPVPGAVVDSANFFLYFIFIVTAMLSLVVGLEKALYLVGFISLLNFSNLIGSPLSMGNLDNSLYLWGILTFAIVLALLMTIFLTAVARTGYAPYRIVRKRKNELARHPIDFTVKEGWKISFRIGMSVTFSTFVNNASSRGPRFSRIGTKRSMVFLPVLNSILALFVVYIYQSISMQFGLIGDFIIAVDSAYTFIFVWNIVSMSFSQERIWLLGSTLGRRRFLGNHILSKSLIAAMLMLPTLIPSLTMEIIGHSLFLRFGLFFCRNCGIACAPRLSAGTIPIRFPSS